MSMNTVNRKKINSNMYIRTKKKRKPSLNDDTTIHPLQWYYKASNRKKALLVQKQIESS
jgi:hypothetical protein